VEALAVSFGISERAIKKNLATLKASGQLRRVGGNFGGHWEVLD
jgi:ATP-dependent DNA helicase RecG